MIDIRTVEIKAVILKDRKSEMLRYVILYKHKFLDVIIKFWSCISTILALITEKFILRVSARNKTYWILTSENFF